MNFRSCAQGGHLQGEETLLSKAYSTLILLKCYHIGKKSLAKRQIKMTRLQQLSIRKPWRDKL